MKTKLVKAAQLAREAILNVISRADIIYVTEGNDWVIRKEALNLKKFFELRGKTVRLALTAAGARGKIVQFGSVNTLVRGSRLRGTHSSNRIFLTWYHAEKDDPRLKAMPEINRSVECVFTSCEATRVLLLEKGLLPEKVVLVPIGIDLSVFKRSPVTKEERRRELGLPVDRVIIGSFQKDGDGWGEGNTPKLIKGPDIFCDVIERVKAEIPVHVLLSGPSRGYVKKRLEAMGVPYTHLFLKNPDEVNRLYEALDYYIISSRVEGGPKALMECWALKVPLVSTRMGMVTDHARDRENAMLAEVGDVAGLSQGLLALHADPQLRSRVTEQGAITVRSLAYEELVSTFSRYYWPEA